MEHLGNEKGENQRREARGQRTRPLERGGTSAGNAEPPNPLGKDYLGGDTGEPHTEDEGGRRHYEANGWHHGCNFDDEQS